MILLTTSCSNDDTGLEFSNTLKVAKVPPTSLEEIMDYPKGLYAGERYTHEVESISEKVKVYLPKIKGDTEESHLNNWWRVYYSLFAEKFPDPSNIYQKYQLEPFDHPYFHLDLEQFKEQVNVLVILDVSGSMANKINGKQMIDIAKDSITDFTSELPKEANVGLMVYGHKGDGSENSKELSCKSVELAYEIQPYNKVQFKEAIDPFEPLGWTPLAHSLEIAKESFAEFDGERNTNLIYVVSDGIETCDGDPVEIATSFSKSNIQPIINVIGFNIQDEGQKQLREIAEAGNGQYTNAGNEEQLQEVFKQAEDMLNKWEVWKEKENNSVSEFYSEQKKEAEKFINNWKEVNERERTNLFSVLNELRGSNYISEEAHEFLELKRTEKAYLYDEIGRSTYKEILDKIERDYKELMNKIEAKQNVEMDFDRE
jgi:Ca-activated chloride channel homolog